ncbi:MAG: hypothetical protein RR623_01575 [Bacilli bacterium]
MIKKILKQIEKLELQRQQKIGKRDMLDEEINILSSQLKDLTNLKNQYEKLEENSNGVFEKMQIGGLK